MPPESRHAVTEMPETIRFQMPPTARIEVSDFGPIASASIDLRPLTVFVGPGNSGKSYMAALLYALSRSFGGFPRYPGPSRIPDPTPDSPSDEEWRRLAKSLATKGRQIRLNDFPSIVRIHAQSSLERVVADDEALGLEIKRCFNIGILSDLVRWRGAGTDARIAVSLTEGDQDLWRMQMEIGTSEQRNSNGIESEGEMLRTPQDVTPVNSNFRLANPELMLPDGEDFHSDFFADLLSSVPPFKRRDLVDEVLPRANAILMYNSMPREAYYLPAVRSGIMQSHRIISSALVSRATRVGQERNHELPTFSGMFADLMTHLVLYDESGEYRTSSRSLYRNPLMSQPYSPYRVDNPVKKIANELEKSILGGTIRNRHESSGQYPEFVFVPNGSDRRIRMSRSASMVSELAPMVLLLRAHVMPEDTLIIEEPEAHLHPHVQTEMATVLAKLARAGVRVIVTTHSDWLLKQLGNLVRRGELESSSRQDSGQQAQTPSSLTPERVGVWCFQENDLSQGSTVKEIPYDRIDGLEPTEYADIDEQLYNQSAKIQNMLDDREHGCII